MEGLEEYILCLYFTSTDANKKLEVHFRQKIHFRIGGPRSSLSRPF
jgi:hypothetical protein